MADISKLEQQEERVHKKIAELWAKELKEKCPEFTSLEDVFNSLSTANQLKRMSAQMRGDIGEQT